MKKTRLPTTTANRFTVLVGTGISVHRNNICKEVELQLKSVQITTDFIVLEPGSTDLILGIQWLRTLGRCEVDWENQELH